MDGRLLVSVSVLTLLEVVGTAAGGKWAQTDETLWMVCCLVLYTMLGGAMALSLRLVQHVNTVNILWQSASIVCVSLVSLLVFDERMTVRQYVGVVFAIFASLCFY